MPNTTFQFSQHSLSDFADCPRRFYLRYVARQAWPPSEARANELAERMEQGALLHTWIERYWSGIQAASKITNEPMATWWQHFLHTDFETGPVALPPERLPELELVAPIGTHRLFARFDLLAFGGQPRQFVIVDWKTTRGPTTRGPTTETENAFAMADEVLRNRLQTRVYLYVLATAGGPFNDGQPIAPEQCSLRYWLADRPEQPWVMVPYSRQDYERDQQQLLELIDDVTRRTTMAEFEKTPDERPCTYCTYRTLCHRTGVADAPMPDEDARLLDLAHIAELDY